MDIAGTLLELAEDHLERMAAVPWADFAKSIHEGKSGETFGCEVDGRYFDLGDQATWLDQPGGDIRLIARASTDLPADFDAPSCIERQKIIRRP